MNIRRYFPWAVQLLTIIGYEVFGIFPHVLYDELGGGDANFGAQAKQPTIELRTDLNVGSRFKVIIVNSGYRYIHAKPINEDANH